MYIYIYRYIYIYIDIFRYLDIYCEFTISLRYYFGDSYPPTLRCKTLFCWPCWILPPAQLHCRRSGRHVLEAPNGTMWIMVCPCDRHELMIQMDGTFTLIKNPKITKQNTTIHINSIIHPDGFSMIRYGSQDWSISVGIVCQLVPWALHARQTEHIVRSSKLVSEHRHPLTWLNNQPTWPYCWPT